MVNGRVSTREISPLESAESSDARSESIIEGFAVETEDHLIFTVKGVLHPSDHLIAYLRYAPDPAGARERAGRRYRRLYHFDEQEALLEAVRPAFLVRDCVLGVRVQRVPRRCVRRVYDPCRRLAALRRQGVTEKGASPATEREILRLDSLVRKAAGAPARNLGISGSILLGLQRPDSDIDVLVYGERVGRAVHTALHDLVADGSYPLRRPNGRELAALHAEHRKDTPLSFRDFVRMQRRKVNELRFRGREVFFRFVKYPGEVGWAYGDRRFEPEGIATIQATISDDEDAIFTPSRYEVTEAAVLGGATPESLDEIVAYRGRFSNQAFSHERVEARGVLEQVVGPGGELHHRLVVGGQAGDYVVVL